MSVEVVKVIAGILQTELELPEGRVMLENQRHTVPTAGLSIIVGYVSGKPIGNNNYAEPEDPEDPESGLVEVQEMTMHHLVQLDVFAFDDEARKKLPEVIMALVSVTAQKAMANNFMSIGRIPPNGFLNVSDVEEVSELNRYSLTVAVTAMYRKVKSVEYFDQFPGPEVHVNA